MPDATYGALGRATGAMRYIIRWDRQGKEGGSDPLGARATIRATSRLRRNRISRVQSTGELANRFRPQSHLVRRAPPARPYLTPHHSAWVRDITYGDTRGRDQGLTLGKPRGCPTVLVHRLCTFFLPGLRTCVPLSSEEGRKRSSRRRGTPSSDTLQLRPSTGSTRSNAQAGTMASPSNPLCLSSSSQSRWVA